MKSRDAKLFLDAWVTKVKGYSTPVVSYDDAVNAVELAESEMKQKAIDAFSEAMMYYTSPGYRTEGEALKHFIAELDQDESGCSVFPNNR